MVLAGGLSHERDVSLRSGRRVAEALRGDRASRSRSATSTPALLPALHGRPAGLRGAAAARRDRRGRRDPRGARAARTCPTSAPGPRPAGSPSTSRSPRPWPRAPGVRTPESFCLPHETFRELGAAAVMEALVARLGLPLMVKPTRSGSALGCTSCATAAELPAAMVNAFAYGDIALVERFVDGTEVAVPVVDDGSGPRALPAGRDRARRRRLRLHRALHRRQHRVRGAREALRRASTAECARVALAAHEALGLRDLSRSDLIVDADGDGVVPRGQRGAGVHRDLDGAARPCRPPASTSAS